MFSNSCQQNVSVGSWFHFGTFGIIRIRSEKGNSLPCPYSVVKINSDASLNVALGMGSIAAVSRYNQGLICALYADVVESGSSVTEVEFLALELAIKLAIDMGVNRVIFEVDSPSVLHIIYGHQQSPSNLRVKVDRCWTLLARFAYWKIPRG